MPDLLAGTIISAADTPPTVVNKQDGFFTFNSTGPYGIDADSGTYVDCGVAFIASTTGRAQLAWCAQLVSDTAGAFVAISPVIRLGSTVGAGATFLAGADNRALIHAGTTLALIGITEIIEGMTPGDPYNVRLEHLTSAGIATAGRRDVQVAPAS